MSNERCIAYSSYYVAFDTEYAWCEETNRQELLEIAGIKVANGQLVGVFETLAKPSCLNLSRSMIDKSKITPEMFANAPSSEEAISQFALFAGNATLVAHNIASDLSVLSGYATFSNLSSCTKAMAEATGYAANGAKLAEVYRACLQDGAKPAIFDGSSHRALPDTAMVVSVYEHLKPLILEQYGDAVVDKHPLIDPRDLLRMMRSYDRRQGNHHHVEDIEVEEDSIDVTNPFYGQNIVTTNCSAETNQAVSEVTKMLGAHWCESLRKKDHPLLVVDNETYEGCRKGSKKPTEKMVKAEKWKLEVFSVRDFTLAANNYLKPKS